MSCANDKLQSKIQPCTFVRDSQSNLDGTEASLCSLIEAPSSNVDSPLATLVDAKLDEDETRTPRAWRAQRAILCIPGFSKLDEAAAIVLAQLLRRRGYGAFAEQYDAMLVAKFFSLDLSDTEIVCICYADRPSNAKLHYAVRRLTKKTKSAYVMALFLGTPSEELEKVPDLSTKTKTFAAAIDAIEQKAREAPAAFEVTADRVGPATSTAVN